MQERGQSVWSVILINTRILAVQSHQNTKLDVKWNFRSSIVYTQFVMVVLPVRVLEPRLWKRVVIRNWHRWSHIYSTFYSRSSIYFLHVTILKPLSLLINLQKGMERINTLKFVKIRSRRRELCISVFIGLSGQTAAHKRFSKCL